MKFKHDVIIVGSGLAGLRAALVASESADVAVLSKVLPTRAHSGAAQGGIAAALGNEEPDSPEWHWFDTVKGGDYLTDQDLAKVLAEDAPRAIYELEHLGVPFNRQADGKIAQRAFGGHTRDFGKAAVKRACHAADRTGRVILDTLYGQALGRKVRIYEEFQMLDLVMNNGQVAGLVAYELATGELHTFEARAVMLATGGIGQVFSTTSNCFGNTGDPAYAAYRQGIPLQDLEFVQFHPTGIHGLGVLISEAARGEGGILRNDAGERFMERYAPTIKDLAARDVVSRAIYTEIKQGRGIGGEDYVHLDLTHLGADKLAEKLNDISSFARLYVGVEPAERPIPVKPTCHYAMGGLPTGGEGQVLGADLNQVPGLYAAGECACVSVHGANRLGCNSLLDLVVFGRRAGRQMIEDLSQLKWAGLPDAPEKSTATRVDHILTGSGNEKTGAIRTELKEAMMDLVGIYRTDQGLKQALDKIAELKERSTRLRVGDKGKVFNQALIEALELDSLLGLSEVMAASALNRTESRGAHSREDYPERDDENWLKHTLATAGDAGPEISFRPVNLMRFEPKPRVY
jgi:succinate dehydrogenase / fumarate reductase flavoprotein subunit